MTILRSLLDKKGIHAVEAGGELAPAQNAFCAKICSKIITSQFCIVLLNNESDGTREWPNANVHMEYGLMLGFNKYVIPFQPASQKLAFNVAGLDTVKYTNQDFERRAAAAIDAAIQATQQSALASGEVDQLIGAFLLARGALVSPLGSDGERNLFEMGRPLGFMFLTDFSGSKLIYFGNFTMLRPEIVVWRLRKLGEILLSRRGAIPSKVALGLATPQQGQALEKLLDGAEVWVLVTSDAEKTAVETAIADVRPPRYYTQVFSVTDVRNDLLRIGSES